MVKRRVLRRGSIASCLWIGLALAPPAALASGPDPILVSAAAGTKASAGNGASENPAISADGRLIAFESTATNLDPLDASPDEDVYVRDLETGTTTLVSRASGPEGAKADAPSGAPSISADGRFVAFASAATNLGPVPPASTQVWVRDLLTQQTILVSRLDGTDGPAANGESTSPSISGDGRLIAFSSDADELRPSDVPGGREVFVRDILASSTTLVSRASGAQGAPAARYSGLPAISASGTHVAFQSNSPVLSGGQTRGVVLWVRDLQTSQTILASRADGRDGRHASGSSPRSAISADGSLAPFSTSRGRIGPPASGNQIEVYLRDISAESTSLVSRVPRHGRNPKLFESILPAISANGRFVSFSVGPAEEDDRPGLRPQGLFVRDLRKEGTLQLLKAPRDGTPARLQSVLSATGRWIAFQSDSPKLGATDRNGALDVFVQKVKRRR